VAIARAIINQPSLLLADEPPGALDSQTTREVLELFDELHQQGITLVLVTHEDDVAARARQIARFQDGRIVEINKSNWGLNNSALDHSVGAI
jgi:putative ABC transport system ATP-binding protein